MSDTRHIQSSTSYPTDLAGFSSFTSQSTCPSILVIWERFSILVNGIIWSTPQEITISLPDMRVSM